MHNYWSQSLGQKLTNPATEKPPNRTPWIFLQLSFILL